MATLAPHHTPQPNLLESDPAPTPRRETLEDRMAGTWGSLLITRAASCPMCGGDLVPRYSSGARPVGGRCRSCGTELS